MKKTGILLVNTGSPDSPSTKDVRRYLREFLMDPHMVDLAFLPRWILVNLIIAPFRARTSAKKYQKIWQSQGSPLVLLTQTLADKMNQMFTDEYQVEIAMRYGKPNIEMGLKNLAAKNCEHVIVVPMFPQYASATTDSVIKEAKKAATKLNLPLSFIAPFYDNELFINAYTKLFEQHEIDEDFILFSYHGLPERQIDKVPCHKSLCARIDACPAIHGKNKHCYRAQCFATTKAIATALNLDREKYMTTFQSRLGKTPWIKPYTDHALESFCQQGMRNITIACPSFTTDCLETLEEIAIRGKAQWQALGGHRFRMIPGLNAEDFWVSALTEIIQRHGDSIY